MASSAADPESAATAEGREDNLCTDIVVGRSSNFNVEVILHVAGHDDARDAIVLSLLDMPWSCSGRAHALTSASTGADVLREHVVFVRPAGAHPASQGHLHGIGRGPHAIAAVRPRVRGVALPGHTGEWLSLIHI